MLPIALGVRLPGTYTAGSVALAIVTGAYLAETIRAGIEAVPKGQMEAARSLGMGYAAVDGLDHHPPGLPHHPAGAHQRAGASCSRTRRCSSCWAPPAATIELTKYGRDSVGDTFNGTPLVAVALVYLAITLPLTRAAAYLERKGKKSR